MATHRALDASEPASLDEALSGSLGWLAVREIAARPLRHGLGPLLEAYGAGSWPDLVPTRTKYKPGRKLTAHYQLRPSPTGPVRDMAVRWHVARVADHGDGPYRATSDDGRVSLLVSPSDTSMPQLERLHRADHLAAMLAAMGEHPAAGARPEIETIRYRPGERHVLRVSAAHPTSVVFVKTDRKDAGASAVPIATAVSAALARACPDATAAEPVGHAPSDAAAVWRRADGQPLSKLVRDDTRTAVVNVGLLGRAVRVIHDHVVGQANWLADDLRAGTARTSDREASATLRAGEHITALLSPTGGTYAALVAEVSAALDRRPVEPPTLIHGDLKCDNVMTADRRITLLDFDRASMGDPALDLGKLMADLRWWLADDRAASDELIAAFRVGYGASDDARWDRARLLSVLFQLTLAARRSQLHDERWAQRVDEQVTDAATALERERAYG